MSQGEFTYQELDDSILEALRLQVIAAGYFPNLRSFQPQSPANVTAFEAAKTAILGTGKQLINVVGNGIPQKKGEVESNTLYVYRAGGAKGSVAVHDVGHIATGPTFARVKTSGATQNIAYEVRFVAADQSYADIMAALVIRALGHDKDYYPIYNITTGAVVPNKLMFLEFTGAVDLNVFEFKEMVYTFRVVDAWIIAGDGLPDGVQTIINPNIVPITTINGTISTEDNNENKII
jgi:hypothetical protein